MNNQSYNKEELQKEVNDKVRDSFKSDDSLDELVRFTLENFSYRYLETKNQKNLKPEMIADNTWKIESSESELIEALKAVNPETKSKLIEQAKLHAKKDGAEVCNKIQIQLFDNKVQCNCFVEWKAEDKTVAINSAQSSLQFEDALELRNKLAKILEEACEIF
tara:strand:- start:401 stop:889 length:489 start_codon:yes stop_codon:yes gene_type:complete